MLSVVRAVGDDPARRRGRSRSRGATGPRRGGWHGESAGPLVRGMFLRPQHFQAADRTRPSRWRTRRTGIHPFNWGIRSVDFDRDAIANYTVGRPRRARPGSRTAPSSRSPTTPRPTRSSSQGRCRRPGGGDRLPGRPGFQPGRANVEDAPTADGPRYWVETAEVEDENTGGDEQPSRSAGPVAGCCSRPRTTPATRSCRWPGSSGRRRLEAPRSSTWTTSPRCSRSTHGRRSGGRSSRSPPDRRADRADVVADRRPGHLVREPGPGRRRAGAEALGPQRRVLVPRGDGLRPRPAPLPDLPRALPPGRPARDLLRGASAAEPAAVRPRGPRRLLPDGHQVHPARPRHDRPDGVREALLRARRRAAPGEPWSRAG